VLYSYREGFGNVSIEAASMNLPVIVSDIPGLKDTIVNNETGLLSRTKDVDDLYSMMLSLYKDKYKRQKFGENGRKRILKYFKRETIWNGQLNLYKLLMKE